jgi:transcriptional regulator of arginine metabolism
VVGWGRSGRRREGRVPTRPQRHTAILRLVRAERIPSQERMRQRLAEEGFHVTQATLSRDMRALGLVKVADREGHGHYRVPPDVVDATPSLAQLLPALFIRMVPVDNLLVLKTVAGGAQPLAAAIDHEDWPEAAGTIAGDDTILIIATSAAARRRLEKRMQRFLG